MVDKPDNDHDRPTVDRRSPTVDPPAVPGLRRVPAIRGGSWATIHPPTRAIVVGGGIAGLFATRVLADVVDEVLLIDRDRLDPHSPRERVPQARHAHALLAAGLQRITAWFPGVVEELLAAGAVQVDGRGSWWFQAGGYRKRGDWGTSGVSMTRPLLERVLRQRVSELSGVRMVDKVAVTGLRVQGGAVTGIEVAGVSFPAELVVDCTGRNSPLARQLESAGLLSPPVQRIHVQMAYASRLLRRLPTDLDGCMAAVPAAPPQHPRSAVLLPVEGDRWLLSLAGMHGDDPGTTDDEFLSFARGLATPVIADIVQACEPAGPVVTHRMPSSQWRRFDKVPPIPGYLALGDSVCSFNPVYGQGMSSAALQAEALSAAIRAHGVVGDATQLAATRGAAKAIATPWAIAAGADFAHPLTTGPKAAHTDLLNRYLTDLIRATHTSLPLARELMAVQHLLAPPSGLVRPAVVWSVYRELRRRRRAVAADGHRGAELTGTALSHPRLIPAPASREPGPVVRRQPGREIARPDRAGRRGEPQNRRNPLPA
jgi:2-polyprenyl-6-methoxyphenol hydroxylase-like FAD-dependent oxidoreductase